MTEYKVAIYWSEDDQAFLAKVPELPGCMADGESYQDALVNVEITINEWRKAAHKLGRKIPSPKIYT